MSTSATLSLPTELAAKPSQDKIVIHDIDTPVPAGLPQPSLWRVLVMPVGMKRTSRKGLIFLPDDAVDAMLWMHQLCKVCAVGPQVMRGPAYEGYEIAEAEKPQIGQLWLVDPKQPRRFALGDINVMIVNDDQLLCRVDDISVVEDLKFFGYNLV